jgi:hypothetical protein
MVSVDLYLREVWMFLSLSFVSESRHVADFDRIVVTGQLDPLVCGVSHV